MDQYLTVSALTKYIKAKLEGDPHLFSIYLKGEVSNFKRHSRGHFYFTLKDEGAQISAIMFANYTLNLNFAPKEGDHVLVKGKISLYEPSGSYSIQVVEMALDGIGELYLKYEALKKELEHKGYFAAERKRNIPKYPKVIAVITSPTGAVIEDIKNTVSRRYPQCAIHLYPALVQGMDSAQSIKKQIERANQDGLADVLIVGRGGGSIEDLWGFNEMATIEAIYQSRIPVITAIGHETDFTISDFVSDLRAPTPTAAAELATPNQVELKRAIDDYLADMRFRIHQYFDRAKTNLLYLDQKLEKLSPEHRVHELEDKMKRASTDLDRQFLYQLDRKTNNLNALVQQLKNPHERILHLISRNQDLEEKLKNVFERIIEQKNHTYRLYTQAMQNLNPLSLMERGYAVVSKNGVVITSIKDVMIDDEVSIRLKDGSLDTKIIRKREKHGKENL